LDWLYRSQATWFDSLIYCRAKLLSGALVPWNSPGEVTAFFGKGQGMFRSDALLVDLGDSSGPQLPPATWPEHSAA
jgi:hypothetical protein